MFYYSGNIVMLPTPKRCICSLCCKKFPKNSGELVIMGNVSDVILHGVGVGRSLGCIYLCHNCMRIKHKHRKLIRFLLKNARKTK